MTDLALDSQSSASSIPPTSEVAELYLIDLGLSWTDLEGKTVLDLGAGLGEFARAAREHGVTVTSVEQRPELWKHEGEPPTDLPYVVADAILLPFADYSFDYVICRAGPLGSEEEQSRFHQIMNEAIRVLKPGGELRFGPTPVAPSIIHPDPDHPDPALEDMALDDRIVHLADQTRQYLVKTYPGLMARQIEQSSREAPFHEYFVYRKP